LAQCASVLCRSTAAQYIQIRVPQYRILKGATSAILFIVLDSIEHTYIYREAKIDVWGHVNTHVPLTCGGPMQSGF